MWNVYETGMSGNDKECRTERFILMIQCVPDADCVNSLCKFGAIELVKEGEIIMAVKNIMIVGVGGQGTLLTSRILGGLAIAGGYDVKLIRGTRNGTAWRKRCNICPLWR